MNKNKIIRFIAIECVKNYNKKDLYMWCDKCRQGFPFDNKKCKEEKKRLIKTHNHKI